MSWGWPSRSNTVLQIPLRASAMAAVSPPGPPPMIAMCVTTRPSLMAAPGRGPGRPRGSAEGEVVGVRLAGAAPVVQQREGPVLRDPAEPVLVPAPGPWRAPCHERVASDDLV